jgi:hypothetical protein
MRSLRVVLVFFILVRVGVFQHLAQMRVDGLVGIVQLASVRN